MLRCTLRASRMAHMRGTQWFLLLLPVFVQGNCGSRPSTQARIVGGSEAPINSWPWQAMLRHKDRQQFCGGTLIDPLWVITAAHCLQGETTSTIFVRMGAHFKENNNVGTEQDIDVVKIIVHENYNTPLRESNDMALLKLATLVNLTENVGPACLPDSINSLVNKTCWITGWGTLSSSGSQPSVLMQASVPLVSYQRCQEAHPGDIDNSMMCAGPDQGGVDACQGDSGGPLVCEFNGKWYLEGVTSWGDGCGVPGKFGVYANVRFFLSWINSRISSNSTSTVVAYVPTSTPTGVSAISMGFGSQRSSFAQSYPSTSENAMASATMATTSSSQRAMAPMTTSDSLRVMASISPRMSVSGNKTSKVFDSEDRSVSPSLLPNTVLILNMLFIYFG